MRLTAHFFMAKIIDLLHSEYYLKKFTKPYIYPKIVTSKPLSSFTDDEKKAILKKIQFPLKPKQNQAKPRSFLKLLIEELAEFTKGKTGFLFKPDKIENWDLPEEDKQKYIIRRSSIFRNKFEISKDFKLYSFRHTYITKIYLELNRFPSMKLLSLITT